MQLGWFACVTGAAHGIGWLGPLVVLVTLAIHVRGQPRRAREVALLGAVVVVGFLIDTSLLRLGLTAIAGATDAPPWLVVLWPNFAATTTRGATLSGLGRRPLVATLLGAVCGPLAYASGVSMGAMTFPRPGNLALIVIGMVWAAFVPLAFVARARAEGTPDAER